MRLNEIKNYKDKLARARAEHVIAHLKYKIALDKLIIKKLSNY